MRVRIGGWQVARGEPDDWRDGATGAGDEHDWWFRAPVDAPVDGELVFEGLATLAEVLVDGEPVARSETMWLPVRAPLAAGTHEVRVVCRALAPRLAERRRPRARWRQQVAGDGNLRWFRTTLLGRAPGFAPGPPVVGLWRPAWFEAGEPRLATRARLDGDDGVLGMLSSAPGTLRVDDSTVALTAHGEAWAGEVRLPGVERWWPHTHGEPVLHEAVLEADGAVLATRRVGFRSLGAPSDLERDGLALRVNGVPVFARGALWTPVPEGEERATLERARDAGLNCVRLPGTGVYESTAFHDLCDELGMLVWQDLMFANLDYPFSDDAFRALVEAEVHELLRVVGGRPSLAVVCGNSEIEQQVAMLGLDPALGRGEFFGAELPALLRAADVDAVHVPSAPCGAGGRPLRADLGVSNYFGVGGYRRPLADARHAGVRFASECLALANVPDDAVASDRTAGVPRDAGADWDFADVRDHYLHLLYGVDPVRLAAADPERYQTLSRTVSGDVMAEVFGEWRRAGSPCGGGLVLWLRDLAPGAGWGLLDHRGEPKAVLGALRRVLSPVAIWMTDEGISGLAVHAANDGPSPLDATVRVALYRDGEHRTREASAPVTVPAHGTWTGDVEAVLGGWVDASYAYRFGPPAHDLVVASLHGAGSALLGQAERFPAGRPTAAASAADLGLSAERRDTTVRIASRRALVAARVHADGGVAAEDGFLVEPGHERVVALTPRAPGGAVARTALTALNLDRPLEVVA